MEEVFAAGSPLAPRILARTSSIPVARKTAAYSFEEERPSSKGVSDMSNVHGWISLAVVTLAQCVAAGPAAAQNQALPPSTRPAAGPAIALLDVSYLFKNLNRFKALREDMNNEYRSSEAEAKAEYDAIARLNQGLQEFHVGTPDYKSREAEIARRQADWTAKFDLRKKELMRKNAKIYYVVYKEICDATNYYMQQHGIDMVVQFNGDPTDPEQPDSVMKFVTRPVIAYRSDMDITPAVLQYLNRSDQSRAR
jgi:Skp family chaperone for outer membrane proteins